MKQHTQKALTKGISEPQYCTDCGLVSQFPWQRVQHHRLWRTHRLCTPVGVEIWHVVIPVQGTCNRKSGRTGRTPAPWRLLCHYSSGRHSICATVMYTARLILCLLHELSTTRKLTSVYCHISTGCSASWCVFGEDLTYCEMFSFCQQHVCINCILQSHRILWNKCA